VVRRTAIVKLAVPDDQQDDLDETIDRFRQAAQLAVDRAFERDENGYVITTKGTLHEETYQEVREATDELNGNLVCAARNLAADAATGIVEAWKDGRRATKPEFTAPTVVYNKKAVTYRDGYCTLASANGGRIEAEYDLPPGQDNPYTEYVRSDEWELRESTLHRRDDGDYYLHIGVRKDAEPDSQAEDGTVLGVDLGIANIAVTSTGTFFGGGLLNHRRDEYERIRGRMQQTGTESAHRSMKSMGGRMSRWSRDLLHRISKAIVQEAITHECGTIVFENLTGIRDRVAHAKKFHQWAFNQLYEYVEYKAEPFGIDVDQVNPRNTSRRCSKCGHTAKNNRQRQDRFCCQQCGYELHADYNAAKNIGWKQVRSGLKSPSGRANYQLALKSGTVNANGSFSPTATAE
jgi:IS605 OrfB family transposase